MKILLTTLNSKYIHTNPALKYLYTAAEASGAHFVINEFNINNNSDYIFTEILSGEYDAICFSCYVWNIEDTAYLAENIKKAQPGVVIVCGGPETGYATADFMNRHGYIDFVVTGEGEYTFDCLVKAWVSKDIAFEDIKGLAYRKDGDIIVNPPAGTLIFDSVPFPYSKLPCENDKIIYYESSRGCPFNCIYCMSSLEKKVRALPLDRVIRDMEYFLGNRVKQVKFIDRTFNWDKTRCKNILKYLINRDNEVTNFHFEMCGEFIDDELVEIIKAARAGLFQFEIGIQSTHRKTLTAVRRSTAVDELLKNTGKLTALGNINVHIDLIAGLPFEHYYAFKTSFNDAYELNADTLQLGFLKLLKGTEMRRKAAMYHYEFKSKAPYEIISNMFLSARDVRRLKQIEELLNLYYNRGGFEKTLRYATGTLAETPFDFYEEFSIFYNLKGFQGRQYKKDDLYRILFDYTAWKCRKISIKTDDFLSLLTEDMDNSFNPDAKKNFEKKGWSIQNETH